MKSATNTIIQRTSTGWRWRIMDLYGENQLASGCTRFRSHAEQQATQKRKELSNSMKNQTIVAIDPGASGGIAWENIGSPYGPAVEPMPDTEGDIVEMLRSIKEGAEGEPIAFIEHVGGFIGDRGQNVGPGHAMFNFGRNFGFCLGAMQSLGFRVQTVMPKAWQKSLSLGSRKDCASKKDWKNKLKQRAQQLYPNQAVTLKTADALLILEHGKKVAC